MERVMKYLNEMEPLGPLNIAMVHLNIYYHVSLPLLDIACSRDKTKAYWSCFEAPRLVLGANKWQMALLTVSKRSRFTTVINAAGIRCATAQYIYIASHA